MELREIRAFHAVADTCHFGRAAEHLHLTQPALSQSIRRLERELGVVLLHRTSRSVRLTGAGEFFLRETRRLVADLDSCVQGVRSIGDGREGLLRIGFTGTAAITWLPRISRLVRAHLPQVVLDVETDLLTPTQVEQLTAGRLDVGVLRGPVDAPGLVTRHLQTETLVLALPAGHRLAAAERVHLADLADEDLVGYSQARSAVDEAAAGGLRAAGVEPRVVHRAAGTSSLLTLVAAGMGVALVPEPVRAMQLDGVVLREVLDPTAIDLSLALPAEHPSAVVGRLLDLLETDLRPPRTSRPTRAMEVTG